MEIAILLYDGVAASDAIGPFEPLSFLPGARIRFVAATPGPKVTNNGFLQLVADHSFADVPAADVLLVPGGLLDDAAADAPTLAWIRQVHETSRYTVAVCSGSVLLGAAGLLHGRRATSHWGAREILQSMGATFLDDRVVTDGKVVTSAGNSAGIDMALLLAADIAGAEVAQAIQLIVEYDPEPPFDSGSLAKATLPVRALAGELIADMQASAAARSSNGR